MIWFLIKIYNIKKLVYFALIKLIFVALILMYLSSHKKIENQELKNLKGEKDKCPQT